MLQNQTVTALIGFKLLAIPAMDIKILTDFSFKQNIARAFGPKFEGSVLLMVSNKIFPYSWMRRTSQNMFYLIQINLSN